MVNHSLANSVAFSTKATLFAFVALGYAYKWLKTVVAFFEMVGFFILL